MKAIITGTFDPITTGHMQIILKACKKFDEIYVVALNNAEKKCMFSLDEREEILKSALQNNEKIIVDSYSGLAKDYMHQHGITTIVRGIRSKKDIEYEIKLAEIMKNYDSNFNTVFFESDDEYKNISSTKIRENIKKNDSLVGLIPTEALETVNRIILGRKK